MSAERLPRRNAARGRARGESRPRWPQQLQIGSGPLAICWLLKNEPRQKCGVFLCAGESKNSDMTPEPEKQIEKLLDRLEVVKTQGEATLDQTDRDNADMRKMIEDTQKIIEQTRDIIHRIKTNTPNT
jgi:hypothetical protein